MTLSRRGIKYPSEVVMNQKYKLLAFSNITHVLKENLNDIINLF